MLLSRKSKCLTGRFRFFSFFLSEERKEINTFVSGVQVRKTLGMKWSHSWVKEKPKYISNFDCLVPFGIAAVCLSSNSENRFMSFGVLIKNHTWLCVSTHRLKCFTATLLFHDKFSQRRI